MIKRHLLLWLTLFSYFISPVRAQQPTAISPQCQALLQGANPANYPPEVVDMCLITGFNQTYFTYENETHTNPQNSSTHITSSNIPEGASCTRQNPTCPPGELTLDNGQTQTVTGTCHLSPTSDQGSCSYTQEITLKRKIKGLDFADPTATNLQNPNILLSTQLKRLLPLSEKLRYTLYLLLYKLAPSSSDTPLYLGAIDPQTSFTCATNQQTYTLQQAKNLLPSSILNLFQQHRWSDLYQQYRQALRQHQLWATVVDCLPLSPSPQPPNPHTSNSPGFTYMRLNLSSAALSLNLPSVTDRYPSDPHGTLYFSSLINLLSQLSTQEQERFFQQLQDTHPIALAFLPHQTLISKQEFFSRHSQLVSNAYTLQDYGDLVTRNPSPQPHLTLPRRPNPTDIQQARAVNTLGFPANTTAIVAKILQVAGLDLGQHFITIPSLNQQIVTAFLQPQLQLELPLNQHSLLDAEKGQPIALKGSTYAGGLEFLHLYQSRNFSLILPFSFPEYCPPQTHIDHYLSGSCQSSSTNPFLSSQ